MEVVEAIKDGSFSEFPFQDNIYKELSNKECPVHTLYIIGHSLDVTDRDIIKLFICNDNVQTKIFYYRKNRNAMEKLSGRERKIVEMRFGILPETEEKTQKEVADILGISQSYISRLEKKIMGRLKKEISKLM